MVKSFIVQAHGPNVIKLNSVIINEFCYKVECLSLASLFSLVKCWWVRSGAYPRVEHLKTLITKIHKFRPKKGFLKFSPGYNFWQGAQSQMAGPRVKDIKLFGINYVNYEGKSTPRWQHGSQICFATFIL